MVVCFCLPALPIVLLLTGLVSAANIAVSNTTCNPHVRFGESASVTCVFSDSITENDTYIVNIYLYNSLHSNGKLVLRYHVESTSCHLYVMPGYAFRPTNSTMQLYIVNSSREKAGNYSCNLHSDDPNNPRNCHLPFPEDPTVLTSLTQSSSEKTMPMSTAMGIGAGAVAAALIVGLVVGGACGYFWGEDGGIESMSRKRHLKVRHAEVKRASILCLQYSTLNLYSVATKVRNEQGEPFKCQQPLPFPREVEEDQLTSDTLSHFLRLPLIFGENDPGSSNSREKLTDLAYAIVKAEIGVDETFTSLRDLFQLCRNLITEWGAGDKDYIGVIPSQGSAQSYIDIKVSPTSQALYVHWPRELGEEVMTAAVHLQKKLRKDARQPTEEEYFFTKLAYHQLRSNSHDSRILREEMQPLGTPGFRPYTQTYIALTDPGEGHILGTVRHKDSLRGAMVHNEYVERPRSLKRNECESYRFPSAIEFARVRLHVGAAAPTTFYVGRPLKDCCDFERDFLKVVNITACALADVFSRGAAECKISMEGLSTSQALRYMKAMVAQVCRTRRQVLSAAWNLNITWLDDIDDEGNLAKDEDNNLVQKKLQRKKDIAMKAVVTTSLGGFDKVTLDGASDSYPSTCFLQDSGLTRHDALTVVHEAHERGLLTYFSAGFKYENILCAVGTGVDGVGIGGAGILHYVDRDSGYHGPYMEENIPRILGLRDDAADTSRGKAVRLLARLDTMYHEGSISETENEKRQDLFPHLLAHNEEAIAELLVKLHKVSELPEESDSPFLHRAKRLVTAESPVLRRLCSAEDWETFRRELEDLILQQDEEGITREYDSHPWATLRKRYHQAEAPADRKARSNRAAFTLKV